jgi:phospholipid/cholesterol/gamma-HCH transport system ATP-binding protein
MALFELRGIKKSFGSQVVLDGVDLDIEKGSFTTIIGRSGCGKSVLLKSIVGLQHADSGSVTFDGVNATDAGESAFRSLRRRVGMLFQNSALFDSMSVADNVAYGLREQGLLDEDGITQRVAEALTMVQLPGTQPMSPVELSGGMRKRVSLARAIAMRPEVVLYDEPTEGLDPVNVTRVYRVLEALRDQLEITTIVVTHNMEAAFRHSERIVLLNQGRIVRDAAPAELRGKPDELIAPFVRASYSAVERAAGQG